MLKETSVTQSQDNLQEYGSPEKLAETLRQNVEKYRADHTAKYNEIIKDITNKSLKGETVHDCYIPAHWYENICLQLIEDGFALKMAAAYDTKTTTSTMLSVAW